MAFYTAAQLYGNGSTGENLSGATTFQFVNSGYSSYFTLETIPNATGSFAGRPTCAAGTWVVSSSMGAITGPYAASVVVQPGSSSLTFTPTTSVTGTDYRLRGTGIFTLQIGPGSTITTFTMVVSDRAAGVPTGFAFDMYPISTPNQQSSVTVDWGDGNSNTYTLDSNVGTLTPTHTYSGILVGPQTVQVSLDNESVLDRLVFTYWNIPSTNGVVDDITGIYGLTSLTALNLYANNLITYTLDSLSLQQFIIYDSVSLTNLTLGNVPNLTTFHASSCVNLTDLNIQNGNLNNCISFRANDCAIAAQGQVDEILTQLDQNGLTGGTVDLSDGTNVAPGVAGLTAAANLIAKGWTVTTN